MRDRLKPGPLSALDEHLAWIFQNRGLRRAIESEERVINDDAPIKRWYDRHLEKLADQRSRARKTHGRRSKVKAR